MNKNQIKLWAMTLTTLLVVLLTGCGSTPDDHRGDAGKVVSRDSDAWATKSGKVTTWHYDYDLTIRRENGTEYDLDVTESGYDHCYLGSSYPKCVDR